MNGRLSMTTLVTALLAATVVGCTDTTVEPKSTVTTANVFKDPNAYTQFIAKVYGGLATTGQQGPTNDADIQHFDEGYSQYIRVWWQLNELPTDEAVVAWGDPNLPEINTGQWDVSSVWIYGMWSRVYFQAAMANEFLRQTTDPVLAGRGVTVGSTLYNTIKTYRAEARFLRALSYWHGLDMFGDIPIVTDADQPGGTFQPKQQTRDSVYKYVVSELIAIQPDLPTMGNAPDAATYGRATVWADHMVLANLYLNAKVYTGTANYAGALAEASAVINSGKFQLDTGASLASATGYRYNFLADNNTSPEIIFGVPFDGKRTETWGGTTFLVHAACGNTWGNTFNSGTNGCWWGLRLKQQAYNRYTAAPAVGTGEPAGDSRAAYLVGPPDQSSVAVTNISDFSTGVAAPKYINVTSTGAAGSDATFPDTDFPMFRLAEAYLIYIEANLNGGGGSATTALDYFNLLRVRAYGDSTGVITAPALTQQMLQDERGRELLWEGKRRTDLIRWGAFTTPSTYTWEWENNVAGGQAYPTFRALFPIPTNELSANPSLTQNPGY